MTTYNMIGASSATNWESINWNIVSANVRRLQIRIAKATREGRHNKAKALQRLLTHSISGKLLAVNRVTSNKGKNTPGVDGVRWRTSRQKWLASQSLKQHGYQACPLRRIYIPKKNGKQRPLGIPIMQDRAMQALYLLALEPISEALADKHSYGFRPMRSCQDAIVQCYCCMRGRTRGKWMLEGDIKACFDNISHEWLLNSIPIDKAILRQWLKAGFIFGGNIHKTHAGTPQGGIISPTLANMALDGMDSAIQEAVGFEDKVHLIRYADDFIVSAGEKQTLEHSVKPAIEAFLSKRGLALSEEKTRITHVSDGADFLGVNIRQYKGKLLIKPAKASVKSLLAKVREVIKRNLHIPAGQLVVMLNPIIRGWCNYHKGQIAKVTFSYIGDKIFWMLMRWIKKRHPTKSMHWRKKKYFTRVGNRDWVFFGAVSWKKSDPLRRVTLYQANLTLIRRHIKVKADADPYNPEYFEYFNNRKSRTLSQTGYEKPD